jgi:hypothetical protein
MRIKKKEEEAVIIKKNHITLRNILHFIYYKLAAE